MYPITFFEFLAMYIIFAIYSTTLLSQTINNKNNNLNRVESPSPSSLGTPQPANIFVQPTSAAPPQQSEPNRNYYNASTFNHGGSYQPQQQNQQQQPQPTPFQQAQPQEQHQQQAQAPTHSYDTSYYSVYDDDIDLYRDIEYHQQQSQEQQKTPTPQYQSAVRQQQAHPTYRPLELPATPKPPLTKTSQRTIQTTMRILIARYRKIYISISHIVTFKYRFFSQTIYIFKYYEFYVYP